ncbi:ATP-binding response regulator [Desulfonatronovibrio hydrogenovorans]|uniref:ATP-binding response regulator n=1 Tax=Desulfonatronovibrio hydrogenovorans TaxID=53245 RepID=UPI0006913ABB|nr:hybrid sensor histidine kinase/response regulator [Desulfonatronovibrio hydrogenovorans]
MQTLHVLIVEDSQDDVQLVLRALEKGGYQPVYERVETAEDLSKALDKSWDLIISDHVMPRLDSFQALKILQQTGQDIPFILVSGSIGEETAVKAMRNGVNDYIMKDKLARLVPAIQRELREAAFRKERREALQDLIKAKEQAEAASAAKTTFLANMSHEIRTPLNGVMGMLQLMLDSPASEEQREYLEIALKSCRRLTELLSDIIDISRIEAGKVLIRQEHFQIRDILTSTEELFHLLVREKGISLTTFCDPRIPDFLLGDEQRLRQVIFNLTANAVKFTQHGQISIEAYPLVTQDTSRYGVIFSVSDTGPGIPEDKLETILDPFVQLSQGFTRKHQGAGLGLAIVRNLVKLMDGDIALQSRPDKGTTAFFCVVLAKPPQD